MISEISQRVAGMSTPQLRGDSGNASRVEGAQGPQLEKVNAPGNPASRSNEAVPVTPTLTQEQLGGVVDDLNQLAQSVRRQLQFSVDDVSGKTLIKVLDAESGEIIREIPAEEVVNMQKRLKEVSDMIFGERVAGVSLLINDKA